MSNFYWTKPHENKARKTQPSTSSTNWWMRTKNQSPAPLKVKSRTATLNLAITTTTTSVSISTPIFSSVSSSVSSSISACNRTQPSTSSTNWWMQTKKASPILSKLTSKTETANLAATITTASQDISTPITSSVDIVTASSSTAPKTSTIKSSLLNTTKPKNNPIITVLPKKSVGICPISCTTTTKTPTIQSSLLNTTKPKNNPIITVLSNPKQSQQLLQRKQENEQCQQNYQPKPRLEQHSTSTMYQRSTILSPSLSSTSMSINSKTSPIASVLPGQEQSVQLRLQQLLQKHNQENQQCQQDYRPKPQLQQHSTSTVHQHSTILSSSLSLTSAVINPKTSPIVTTLPVSTTNHQISDTVQCPQTSIISSASCATQIQSSSKSKIAPISTLNSVSCKIPQATISQSNINSTQPSFTTPITTVRKSSLSDLQSKSANTATQSHLSPTTPTISFIQQPTKHTPSTHLSSLNSSGNNTSVALATSTTTSTSISLSNSSISISTTSFLKPPARHTPSVSISPLNLSGNSVSATECQSTTHNQKLKRSNIPLKSTFQGSRIAKPNVPHPTYWKKYTSHISPKLQNAQKISPINRARFDHSSSYNSPCPNPSSRRRQFQASPSYELLSSAPCLLSPFTDEPLSPSAIENFDVLGSPKPGLGSNIFDIATELIKRSPIKRPRYSIHGPSQETYSSYGGSQNGFVIPNGQDNSIVFSEPKYKKLKMGKHEASEKFKQMKSCYSSGLNMMPQVNPSKIANDDERASAILTKLKGVLKQSQNFSPEPKRLGVLQMVPENANFVKKSTLKSRLSRPTSYLSMQSGKENIFMK